MPISLAQTILLHGRARGQHFLNKLKGHISAARQAFIAYALYGAHGTGKITSIREKDPDASREWG
jgi:hypothetical protein